MIELIKLNDGTRVLGDEFPENSDVFNGVCLYKTPTRDWIIATSDTTIGLWYTPGWRVLQIIMILK
jgi:hypothetical protein